MSSSTCHDDARRVRYRWCSRWPSGSASPSSTYGLSPPGSGLYTDMNAIRRDEDTGQPPLHLRRSVGLGKGDRAAKSARVQLSARAPWSASCARSCYGAETMLRTVPGADIRACPQRDITFITSAGTGGPVSRPGRPKEREDAFVKKHPHRVSDADRRRAARRQAARRPRPGL